MSSYFPLSPRGPRKEIITDSRTTRGSCITDQTHLRMSSIAICGELGRSAPHSDHLKAYIHEIAERLCAPAHMAQTSLAGDSVRPRGACEVWLVSAPSRVCRPKRDA